ncbi:MAG: ABC transporter substrate-binding protein, partial [Betaproteobacteria bacterium]
MTASEPDSRRRAVVLASGGLMLVAALPGLAQAAGGSPIRVGGTLPLTGPLASVGTIHKIAGEVFIDSINKRGGLLGRKLQWVLLDDQSQPANARTLYERLITA